ncbi:hypothetical protein HPB49_006803 [Dermacentor silvarum]|uniref:Uncharacterized protein n=1 Tax=Dermacentor silvarum TaxID=543639 RepID=A0ACB8DN68_DERSI|nr:hypothetical protein HPB49_006803 [Dermacentor silvarum]
MLASVATGVGVVSLSAHQYAYGLHFVLNIVALAFTTPFIVYVFLPVLYPLKVTSVFQISVGIVGNLLLRIVGNLRRFIASFWKERTLQCSPEVATVSFSNVIVVLSSPVFEALASLCCTNAPTI